MATQEIEIHFQLDEDGRTAHLAVNSNNSSSSKDAPLKIALDYTTQSVPTLLSRCCHDGTSTSNTSSTTATRMHCWSDNEVDVWDALLLDCEIADSGLMPRTFWMPASGMQPRFHLEQFALDVFYHHVNKSNNSSVLDVSRSGAEWWVQLRPSPEKAGRYAMHEHTDYDNNDDNDLEDKATTPTTHNDLSRSGISFHWDKDEELRILLLFQQAILLYYTTGKLEFEMSHKDMFFSLG
jgi:hypothetical protein